MYFVYALKRGVEGKFYGKEVAKLWRKTQQLKKRGGASRVENCVMQEYLYRGLGVGGRQQHASRLDGYILAGVNISGFEYGE
jgi:hypothetical protein